MRGVVPAGRVQIPPQVQCRPSRLEAARNSCSPLAGSTRWLSRSQVTGAGVPTAMPPQEVPSAKGISLPNSVWRVFQMATWEKRRKWSSSR